MRYLGMQTLIVLWIPALAWRRIRGRSSRSPISRDEMAALCDAQRRAASERLVDDRANPRQRAMAEGNLGNVATVSKSTRDEHKDQTCIRLEFAYTEGEF